MNTHTQKQLDEIIRLHGLWLRGEAMGVRANLDRARLVGANLDGADLRVANLRGANLRGANLDGANLRGASLDGANLRGASLDGANLVGANLRGASLDGASLDGASLVRANLEGANLLSPLGKSSKIKSAMGWTSLYHYWVFVAITDTGTFVRMGCKWLSIEEWEANFWNNNSEFPNDGSSKSNMRLAAYNFAKEWIKNNS